MQRRQRATGLATAGIGTPLRLTSVDVPGAQRLRLAEFGMRPGARLTVLGRTAGGGWLVGLEHSRVAVDRTTGRRLAVEPAA